MEFRLPSLAEGLTWIERSGLDPEKSLAFLKAGRTGAVRCIGALSARMASHNYEVNFLLQLMAKDLQYARRPKLQDPTSN